MAVRRIYLPFVALCFLLVSLNGFASTLFTAPVPHTKKIPQARTYSISSVDNSQQQVTLNLEAVNKLASGDTLTLNLLAGSSYEAQITQVFRTAAGSKQIQAEFTHNALRFPSLITLGKRAFSIQLNTPAGMYVVDGEGTRGSYRPVPPLSEEHSDDGVRWEREYSEQALPSADSDEAIAEVDILVVYTGAAARSYNGEISPKIDNMVHSANQIFSNSDVYIRLNKVHTTEVEYDEATTNATALSDLRHGRGPFAHIAALQHEVAADLVVLLKPTAPDDDSSGRGYINNLASYYAPLMYSVTNVESGGAVLAHEIGHNFGLAHSRAQGNEGATFGFGVGYRLALPEQGGFATVMAYSAENAPSVPFFSGPQSHCQGLPCGVSRTKSHGADAQYALNAVRAKVADILTAGVQPMHLSEAVDKVVDDSLKSCIQAAAQNLRYASQLNHLSCWNAQIQSLDGLEQFNHLSYLDLDNNAVSDLAPLSGMNRLAYLSLNGNQVRSLAPLEGMKSLSALLLNNNPLEDISALVTLQQLTVLRLFAVGIDSLPDLSQLEHLRYVDAGSNGLTTLSSLQNNANLQQLYAPGNRISVYPKNNQWQNLNTLDLSYNQLSSVAGIDISSALQSLNLARNRLSIIKEISVLQWLQELTLSDNDYSSLDGIGTLSRLEYLAADSNYIDDIDAIATLSHLHHLALADNRLTDISGVSNLLTLRSLDVRNNQISDIMPLADIRALESLWLDGNSVGDISTLFQHYQLTSLSLSDQPTISCWQQDYMRWLVPELNPTLCDESDDNGDYDNDGVDNRSELSGFRNPAYKENGEEIISFALPEATFAESAGEVTVVLVRRGSLAGSVSAVLSSAEGSAEEGADYQALSLPVTFAAGQLLSRQRVTLVDDEQYEGEENFYLNLSEPLGATLGLQSTFTVRLSMSDVQAGPAIGWDNNWTEVSEGQQRLTLSLVKPAEFNHPFTVMVEGADMTAREGEDYRLVTSALHFLADETEKTVEVEILNNAQATGDKMFVLNLYDASGIALNSESAVMAVNITEDDVQSKGVVEFADAEMAVAEADGDIEIRLIRRDGDAGSLNVTINIVGESSAHGDDYVLSTSEVTFSAGETTIATTLSVVDDRVKEGKETLVLQLSSAESGVIGGQNRLSIVISDNEASVVESPEPTSSSAGGSLAGLILIILTALASRLLAVRGMRLYVCPAVGRATQK